VKCVFELSDLVQEEWTYYTINMQLPPPQKGMYRVSAMAMAMAMSVMH
jgi:hypothetical protein